jgi:hypothetical protein
VNLACGASSSPGGGVVGVATGPPTSLKNSSCPDGERIQIILTGWLCFAEWTCGIEPSDPRFAAHALGGSIERQTPRAQSLSTGSVKTTVQTARFAGQILEDESVK